MSDLNAIKKYFTYHIGLLKKETKKKKFKSDLSKNYEDNIKKLQDARKQIEDHIYDENRQWIEAQATALHQEIMDPKKKEEFFKSTQRTVFSVKDINSFMPELRKRKSKKKSNKTPKYFG